MRTVLITGVGGLVGSEAASHFHSLGYAILGVDNDLRGKLLGDPTGSTGWNIRRLAESLDRFTNYDVDVRDFPALTEVFKEHGDSIKIVIHCAAQPAHEGMIREDFDINAVGTLNVLELLRQNCADARFVYLSTIKVYGSYPNTLEYEKQEKRFDLAPTHPHYEGFDESTPIDQGISSFFGRSKTAADLYVQEFHYQYGLDAICLRASCLTGGYHSGTEAHGMLSYLMKCAVTESPYVIYGYEGFQVRDQLHAQDLVSAVALWCNDPKEQIVYNLGGGRGNACSILEAIEMCEEISGKTIEVSHGEMRAGDHAWWVTDNSRFKNDFPAWRPSLAVDDILEEIYKSGLVRWA